MKHAPHKHQQITHRDVPGVIRRPGRQNSAWSLKSTATRAPSVLRPRQYAVRALLPLAYTLVFQLICIYIYEAHVVLNFRFTSLLDRGFEKPILVVCLLEALIPISLLTRLGKRTSSWALWMIYLSVLSTYFYIGYANWIGSDKEFLVAHSVVVGAFIVMLLPTLGKVGIIKRWRAPRVFFNLMLPCVLVAFVLWLALRGGSSFSLSFEDAYDRRDNAREVLRSRSVASYWTSFVSNVSIIFLAAIGIRERKTYFTALGIACGVLLYAFDGTKTSIAMPFIIIAILYMCSRTRVSARQLVPISFAVLALASAIEIIWFRTDLITNYLLRRQVMVPQELTAIYWHYTQGSGLMLFRDSSIMMLFNEVPEFPVARLVGETYYGSATSNANANLFASAYSQTGTVGVFAFAYAGGLLLRFIDLLEVQGDNFLSIALCLHIGVVWSNGALHSSFLSNGILMGLLLIFLYPSSTYEKTVKGTKLVSVN